MYVPIYFFCSSIQQAQKFFMETNDTNDARNVSFCCLCHASFCHVSLDFLSDVHVSINTQLIISLFLTDGLPICWQSCVHCSLGCCGFIIHGVVGVFYPEMAHCWRSWNSFANPCWSRGAVVFICLIADIIYIFIIQLNQLVNLHFSCFRVLLSEQENYSVVLIILLPCCIITLVTPRLTNIVV